LQEIEEVVFDFQGEGQLEEHSYSVIDCPERTKAEVEDSSESPSSLKQAIKSVAAQTITFLFSPFFFLFSSYCLATEENEK
jgi:hypothetical protein